MDVRVSSLLSEVTRPLTQINYPLVHHELVPTPLHSVRLLIYVNSIVVDLHNATYNVLTIVSYLLCTYLDKGSLLASEPLRLLMSAAQKKTSTTLELGNAKNQGSGRAG